jgi:hypothetical protein
MKAGRSRAAVDRGWPYQIALPGEECKGKVARSLRSFCSKLSVCEQTHNVCFEDDWRIVICFAKRKDANAFL